MLASLCTEKLEYDSPKCHAGLCLIEVKDLQHTGPPGPRGLITNFIIAYFRKMSMLSKLIRSIRHKKANCVQKYRLQAVLRSSWTTILVVSYDPRVSTEMYTSPNLHGLEIL